MITIKVKLRESTIKRNKGTIYYLLTGNKEYREIVTPNKIYPYEWDEKRSLIAISNAEYQRRHELQLIENSIIRDIRHLQHILANENNIDLIVKHFKRSKVKVCYLRSAVVSQMIYMPRINLELPNHIWLQ